MKALNLFKLPEHFSKQIYLPTGHTTNSNVWKDTTNTFVNLECFFFLTTGHTCLPPLGNSHYLPENGHFRDMEFCISPTKFYLKKKLTLIILFTKTKANQLSFRIIHRHRFAKILLSFRASALCVDTLFSIYKRKQHFD